MQHATFTSFNSQLESLRAAGVRISCIATSTANPAAGDLGPEGLHFVPWYLSPTFRPLLIVGNEISGSTTIYQLDLKAL